MVLKPEPLFEAVKSLLGTIAHEEKSPASLREGREAERRKETGSGAGTAVVLLSAAGRLFRQKTARRFAGLERIILLCGRYEGVDERVAEHLATEELSVGDFVLSGGELPAAAIVDAVTRLLPGALGNEASAVHESFSQPVMGDLRPVTREKATRSKAEVMVSAGREPRVTSPGILDCPHYTRPAEFRGWAVPEVLVSGNHEQIRRWRRQMALAKTLRNRPELLAGVKLSEEERRRLEELGRQAGQDPDA